MRLLHTGDWHLGRLFHGVHLTDDQAHILTQVVDIAREERVDVVIIAGDVFDRAVPPVEAVSLLDEVLSRLAADLAIPVIIIAGNHDSARRLAFGSKLLAANGLHVAGAVSDLVLPVTLDFGGRGGPVHFYCLPYAEPAEVRLAFDDEEINTHDSAMSARVTPIRAARSQKRYKERAVLVAHAFVERCEQSESERPLTVGGAGSVKNGRFDGFSYVALGHLHRPQRAGKDAIQYAGSLLKYSFTEAEHKKSVTIVDLDEDDKLTFERIPLKARRDVRVIEGSFQELLSGTPSDDFVLARILGREAILDALGKLREIYPNVLHIERPEFVSQLSSLVGGVRDVRRLDYGALFKAFYKEVTGLEVSTKESELFSKVVEEVQNEEREGAAIEQ